MSKGYVHVYTGDGKGKTTAAFGLALRAACAGKNVYIGQFVKDMAYSETAVKERYENIMIEQLGDGCFIESPPQAKDVNIAKDSLDKCANILAGGEYDVVVLDEVFIAIYFKLFSDQDLIEIIEKRVPHVEVILTGRYASSLLIEFADLVTEMKEIKHYYQQGVLSRPGIDC